MSLAFTAPARSGTARHEQRSSHGPQRDASAGRGRNLASDLAFLPGLGVGPQDLLDAEQEAQRIGVFAHEALLAAGVLSEEAYYRALARRIGARFTLTPERLGPAPTTPGALAAGMAHIPEADVMVLAPRGRALIGLLDVHMHAHAFRSRFVVTTPRCFAGWCREADSAAIAARASHELGRADPMLTAMAVPSRETARGLGAIALAVAGCLALGGTAWLVLSLLVAAFMFGSVALRLSVAWEALFCGEAGIPDLPDHELPRYTIVVPLYREADVVLRVLRALDRLDYPRARLDIKILVERDDPETLAALEAAAPGPVYDIIVAPDGAPRTKPRALNIGMAFATGNLLVVYDAEDEPAPMQLRQAAAMFAAAGPELACVQGRLAIDNARDSWLAALFALEYAALFDVINPGLASLRLPILLGGTSNHFRISALRALHGWDAWNVTEDADMGIRLARRSFRVAALSSTTDEEAPARLRPWLSQRRRWMKGWMQTLIVHLRDPRRLFRDLGPLRATSVILLLVNGLLGPLAGPLYAVAFLHDALFGALLNPQTIADIVASTLWCSIAVLGSIAMLMPLLIGAQRRRLRRLLPRLIALPVYHALLSLAAVLAAGDLLRRPHHWAKTPHGLARTSLRERGRPALVDLAGPAP